MKPLLKLEYVKTWNFFFFFLLSFPCDQGVSEYRNITTELISNQQQKEYVSVIGLDFDKMLTRADQS